MPRSRRSESTPERSRPRPDEQVTVAADLVALRDDLIRRATKLCSGLRPPPPDPREVYSEVVARMLAAYRDGDLESTRRTAYAVLANCVCDVARGYRFDAGVAGASNDDGDGDADADLASRAADPMTLVQSPASGIAADVKAALARLDPAEQCVVLRVELEYYSVKDACRLCGLTTKSPDYVYQKLLGVLREQLQEYR